ncbi:MAG TPA: SDR family oxidoreductase [Candidatus Limnocylindrales bacterium]|nr:SDR family oxidoreductase [Candidatus Limnocylindrales bacterium]
MADNPTRALVTGASSGIGRSFAAALAAQGCDLVLTARNQSRLEELAGELRSRHGRSVDVLVADLEAPQDLARVEEYVRNDTRIDLLVNNAGYGVTGNFADLPLERSQGQIDLNVVALTRLSHAALSHMKPSRRGGVINIASGAAFLPTPALAVYSATKAYVVNFSLALAEETRGHGVQVLVVCPGFTRTEFQTRAQYDTSALPAFVWQTADDVVLESLAAYRKGQTMLVPGVQNRVTMALTNLVPKTLLVSLAGRFSKQPAA